MSIIIRNSMLEDIPKLAHVSMKLFNDEGILAREDNRIEYFLQILRHCHNSRLTKLAFEGDEMVGVIAVMIVPRMIVPHNYDISAFAQWVKPELRGGSTYYRLFKPFLADAKEAIEEGRAKRILMYSHGKNTNINYSRLGFTPYESTYVLGG